MRIPSMLLTQTCVISALIGETPNGPKYDTDYTAKCRFEKKRKKRVSIKGKEYISAGILFLLLDTANLALKPDSKVTIDSNSYILSETNARYGFTPSHLECVVV